MIWHIVTRELLDHLTSLRFALTTLILVALMVTNAVVHLQTHPERVRRYSEKVSASRAELKSRTELYALLQKGAGKLYKRPSSLAFIADGGEALLPDESVSGGFWRLYGLAYIWSMGVPRLNMETLSNHRPTATVIDWVFIITYLLSFIPLLFTFDALSGERERGTLRLCLANSISRSILLMGKFLGSLITVLIAFYCAVLFNLAIVSTGSWTQFGAADWGRVGLIVLIASCYAGIFAAIGLIISAMTRESRLSLVLLLLIWVTVVVFMPSTLGTLSTKWMPPIQTHHQFQRAKGAAIDQIRSDFLNKREALKERRQSAETSQKEVAGVDTSELEIQREFVNKDMEIRERLSRQHLAAQSAQVLHARRITRCSPAAVVQYALESMAGTGFNRHLQFLEHCRLHIRQFRNFIVEMDRSDPESLHVIGIPKGMSKKPVLPEAIPIFEDKLSFQDTLNPAIIDMLLLILLLAGVLSGAFLVFLRSEV
ncbi:MAG: ABC transporter permease subunit [Candidatus Poribacteria bacterium]|nr:ABC transporter permease subunit [Candidatus Poribacteria bacterium]